MFDFTVSDPAERVVSGRIWCSDASITIEIPGLHSDANRWLTGHIQGKIETLCSGLTCSKHGLYDIDIRAGRPAPSQIVLSVADGCCDRTARHISDALLEITNGIVDGAITA